MEVITVANNKGGVGKTMQCYQLACYLAYSGKKVLVVDLDSQSEFKFYFWHTNSKNAYSRMVDWRCRP